MNQRKKAKQSKPKRDPSAAETTRAASPEVIDPLVFIDTNILLDFYRAPAGNVGLSLLKKVNSHHNVIITGDQVEMEFKKNRHSVILGLHSQMQAPGGRFQFPLPAFLSGSSEDKAFRELRTALDDHARGIREVIERVLREPATADPVYAVVEKLFRADTVLSLSRTKGRDERTKIRERAQRRFLLGYPPRKPGDTSMGDAINWEWMLECVERHGRDLVIVSRDTDFGVSVGGQEPVLNDWLRCEFEERTKGRRHIVLTQRLAVALKLISVAVSQDEVAEESAIIEERARLPLPASDPRILPGLAAAVPDDLWHILQMLAQRRKNNMTAIIASNAANQQEDELPRNPGSQDNRDNG